MGKNEKTPITVEDQEYFVEDLNEQQQLMVNHIADLDKKIRQLGVSANNFFKKGDIAEGFKELAKGGRTTAEALSSLPAIMNAAVVGEMKLAEASQTSVKILTAFNIEARNTDKAMNRLVQATNAAPQTFKQLTDALFKAAGTAKVAGLTFNETTKRVIPTVSAAKSSSTCRKSLLV